MPAFTHSWLEACSECLACGLAQQRQHVVISRGNPEARVMLIGEAPGANEDVAGEPFVGRSGQLLDRLLIEVGFDPLVDVFVTNAVKCRPPDNRKPTTAELLACRPWLDQQINVVNPRWVVLVGATAVRAMLGRKQSMGSLRGQWIALHDRQWMPIFHPSYLLRNPSCEPGKPVSLTRDDLRQVRAQLCQGEPASGEPIP